MVFQEKKPGESIDSVLRKFKRKVKNAGILQDLRKRESLDPKDLVEVEYKASRDLSVERRAHIAKGARVKKFIRVDAGDELVRIGDIAIVRIEKIES